MRLATFNILHGRSIEDDVPGTASYGVALLSRYPVRTWQTLRLPRIGFRFPMYLPKPAKVIMVHQEPRAAVIAHLDTPAGPMIVANTHLSFVPGRGRRRTWQNEEELMSADEDPLLIRRCPIPARRPGAVELRSRRGAPSAG